MLLLPQPPPVQPLPSSAAHEDPSTTTSSTTLGDAVLLAAGGGRRAELGAVASCASTQQARCWRTMRVGVGLPHAVEAVAHEAVPRRSELPHSVCAPEVWRDIAKL